MQQRITIAIPSCTSGTFRVPLHNLVTDTTVTQWYPHVPCMFLQKLRNILASVSSPKLHVTVAPCFCVGWVKMDTDGRYVPSVRFLQHQLRCWGLCQDTARPSEESIRKCNLTCCCMRVHPYLYAMPCIWPFLLNVTKLPSSCAGSAAGSSTKYNSPFHVTMSCNLTAKVLDCFCCECKHLRAPHHTNKSL